MKVTITPAKLCGKIDAIASKSFAHRIMIASALADKPTKINLNTTSEDIESTKKCLLSMGTKIEEGEGFITISPVTYAKNAVLDCNESGSTARFLLPVAATICDSFKMRGSGRLPERPMTPLISQMRLHGVEINSDKIPLEAIGKLNGGKFEIPGDISSQYITGLLLALPNCTEKSEIVLTSPLQSRAYVDITIGVLKQFGIEVLKTENSFIIKPQKFISPDGITVEGDWSNSAFWIVANEICGNVLVDGLNYDSLQGDMNILISKDETRIDASEIPDLVPILAVLACARKGKTIIYNAERLRIKESDRLETVRKSLSSLGADIEETKDGLIINGTGSLKGGECESFNDHRIAMSCAIASCICENKVIIKDAQAVNKSYPKFFEDFESLGGKIVIE